MSWSSFVYLTKQGLHSLKANRMMSFASIGVLTACLILTGIASLFSANVNSMVDYLGDQNESVVYLQRDLTPEQEAYLQNEGCDEVQGYFYSRPLAAPALWVWMRNYQQALASETQ